MSGIGVSILAAAVNTPAFAQTDHSNDIPKPLQDPTTLYPKPSFEGQSQPWPGLVNKMNPRPDHGEKSYKGSVRVAGRKALITGGDSGMRRAAAIAYAREGADVAINYFQTEEPDAKEVIKLIEAEGRKAVALPGGSGPHRVYLCSVSSGRCELRHRTDLRFFRRSRPALSFAGVDDKIL